MMVSQPNWVSGSSVGPVGLPSEPVAWMLLSTSVSLGPAKRRTRVEPLVSPIFADFTGLSPLLIQVGQYEIIRDDSVRVAEKARADGVEVTLEVYEGMFHVFQSHEPLLPEGREAVAHLGAFLRRLAG